MLLYGKAHQEISAVVDQLKRSIAEGEAMLAEQRDRLEHFIATEAALLGITDPASLPSAQVTDQAQALNSASAAAGSLAQTEAQTAGTTALAADPDAALSSSSAASGLSGGLGDTPANDTQQQAEQGASA